MMGRKRVCKAATSKEGSTPSAASARRRDGFGRLGNAGTMDRGRSWLATGRGRLRSARRLPADLANGVQEWHCLSRGGRLYDYFEVGLEHTPVADLRTSKCLLRRCPRFVPRKKHCISAIICSNKHRSKSGPEPRQVLSPVGAFVLPPCRGRILHHKRSIQEALWKCVLLADATRQKSMVQLSGPPPDAYNAIASTAWWLASAGRRVCSLLVLEANSPLLGSWSSGCGERWKGGMQPYFCSHIDVMIFVRPSAFSRL
ncbi:hypothetical protein B0J14DRAFT_140378 [Halenospora varia]|nr:hypothetical protein B0J14DRAFT_140378 [Halenospora varia]